MMQWSRKRRVQVVSMAAIASLSTMATVARQAPETQQVAPWILQALEGPSTRDTLRDRGLALSEIRRSESLRENDQVRMALLTALDRANEEYRGSFLEGAPEYGEGQGETLLELVWIVTSLQDTRAIPTLVGSVHTGTAPWQALADFGEQALDPMITAWEERPTTPGALVVLSADLLSAMAHYVEASAELSDSHRARLTDVAGDILARRELLMIDDDGGGWAEVTRATQLAVSLADPALVAQVETIAQMPLEVRGNSETVDHVIRNARRVLDQAREQGR